MGNCRWAEARNRRAKRLVEIDGKKVTLAKAAERTEIPASTIQKPLAAGLSRPRTSSTPATVAPFSGGERYLRRLEKIAQLE